MNIVPAKEMNIAQSSTTTEKDVINTPEGKSHQVDLQEGSINLTHAQSPEENNINRENKGKNVQSQSSAASMVVRNSQRKGKR